MLNQKEYHFPAQTHGQLSEGPVQRWIQSFLPEHTCHEQVAQSLPASPNWSCRVDLMIPEKFIIEIKCPRFLSIHDRPSWSTFCQVQANMGICGIPETMLIKCETVFEAKKEKDTPCTICADFDIFLSTTPIPKKSIRSSKSKCTGRCQQEVLTPVGPLVCTIRNFRVSMIPFLKEYFDWMVRTYPSFGRITASQVADQMGLYNDHSMIPWMSDPRLPFISKDDNDYFEYCHGRPHEPLVAADWIYCAKTNPELLTLFDSTPPETHLVTEVETEYSIILPSIDDTRSLRPHIQRQITHLIIITESCIRWVKLQQRSMALFGAVFHDPKDRVWTRWDMYIEESFNVRTLIPVNDAENWRYYTVDRVISSNQGSRWKTLDHLRPRSHRHWARWIRNWKQKLENQEPIPPQPWLPLDESFIDSYRDTHPTIYHWLQRWKKIQYRRADAAAATGAGPWAPPTR